jgi:hypothetical protein
MRRGRGGCRAAGQACGLAAGDFWLEFPRANPRRSLGRKTASVRAGGLHQMRRQAEAPQASNLPAPGQQFGTGHRDGALFPRKRGPKHRMNFVAGAALRS